MIMISSNVENINSIHFDHFTNGSDKNLNGLKNNQFKTSIKGCPFDTRSIDHVLISNRYTCKYVLNWRRKIFMLKDLSTLKTKFCSMIKPGLTLFKQGFFWLSMTGGGVDSTPSRKQCYSSARTMKLGTGVFLPKTTPVPNLVAIA